jgi:hypothetical protein
MNCLPTTQTADDFADRARGAGHPIQYLAPGPWPMGDHCPSWSPMRPDGEMTPNDLLDHARATARDRVAWVHAVLATYADAVRLAAAVQPVPPRAPQQRTGRASRSPWVDLVRRPDRRSRGGDPRRVPFGALVDQMPLSVVTLTAHVGGRMVHVVEIPAGWLARPLRPVPR